MNFLPSQKSKLPAFPGIYKFFSGDNNLLYVGKAKNLKNRVSSYFLDKVLDPKTQQLVSQIHHIEVIPVSSEFEALLLEAKFIKDTQPKYNVVWRDDKHFLYVKITKERFPKILLARKNDGDGDFFGPFPSGTTVREVLSYIRTIFPYCTQKETAKRACFYNHLGLCNPCPAEVMKKRGEKFKLLLRQYRDNIANIRQILRGKVAKARKILDVEMQTFSRGENYEKAGIYRDKLMQLDYLTKHYIPTDSYLENPKLLSKIRQNEETELITLLKQYYPRLLRLKHIECYDISNISGKLATGSMVSFQNGEPCKDLYRRFRIRFTSSPDDFAMIREVISRRLSHTEWELPDMIIIDGGKPQLIALNKALGARGILIPNIGLAKVYEEIIVLKGNFYEKIKLPTDSPALNLVKRLRDEAHRFAHSYHSLLRLKYLLSTVENK